MKNNAVVIVRHENADYSDAYRMVEEALYLAGYDKEHYGSPEWNPLGWLIKPGNKVLLKPNMVTHANSEGGTECLYTQAQVVRPVIDYALKALAGNGSIIIGDAPVQECDFKKFAESSGYGEMTASYSGRTGGVSVALKDLRGVYSCVKHGAHYYVNNPESSGINIDLGTQSAFSDIDASRMSRLRVTNYDPAILKSCHGKDKHVYSIARDVIEADVIISLPKPKTHRKAGLTIALKNSIGMAYRKECLPHHTNGSPAHGGDQYANSSVLAWTENILSDMVNVINQRWRMHIIAWPFVQCRRVLNRLLRIFCKNKTRDGSWKGNDTICRSIADINRCILYGDIHGKLQRSKQRKYLVIADMIISGEHNGPLSPEPKRNGIIALGENPVSFDMVISTLMGIKPEYFRTLKYATAPEDYRLIETADKEPVIISNDSRYDCRTLETLNDDAILFFKPSDEWAGAFRSRE